MNPSVTHRIKCWLGNKHPGQTPWFETGRFWCCSAIKHGKSWSNSHVHPCSPLISVSTVNHPTSWQRHPSKEVSRADAGAKRLIDTVATCAAALFFKGQKCDIKKLPKSDGRTWKKGDNNQYTNFNLQQTGWRVGIFPASVAHFAHLTLWMSTKRCSIRVRCPWVFLEHLISMDMVW